MSQLVDFQGVRHQFPDAFSQDQIAQALKSYSASAPAVEPTPDETPASRPDLFSPDLAMRSHTPAMMENLPLPADRASRFTSPAPKGPTLPEGAGPFAGTLSRFNAPGVQQDLERALGAIPARAVQALGNYGGGILEGGTSPESLKYVAPVAAAGPAAPAVSAFFAAQMARDATERAGEAIAAGQARDWPGAAAASGQALGAVAMGGMAGAHAAGGARAILTPEEAPLARPPVGGLPPDWRPAPEAPGRGPNLLADLGIPPQALGARGEPLPAAPVEALGPETPQEAPAPREAPPVAPAPARPVAGRPAQPPPLPRDLGAELPTTADLERQAVHEDQLREAQRLADAISREHEDTSYIDRSNRALSDFVGQPSERDVVAAVAREHGLEMAPEEGGAPDPLVEALLGGRAKLSDVVRELQREQPAPRFERNRPESAQERPESAQGKPESAQEGSVTLRYMRNPERAPQGAGYGQDVEPAGRYLSEVPRRAGRVPEGWETGTVTFENPLRVDWGKGGYADPDNWKRVLSERYGGLTGEPLSRAIAADGHDGIVTYDNGETSEIVDLRPFAKRASAQEVARDRPNAAGQSGEERVGQEPVPPRPLARGGGEAARGRRVVQGPPAGEEPVQPVAAPEGKPVQRFAPVAEGAETTVKTERGTPVRVRYALAERDQLVASHDLEGNRNPAYPAEIQPRDRSRLASADQLRRMARDLDPERLGASPTATTGAPILGPDGVVESGNWRSLAIQQDYETARQLRRNTAYRNWLYEHAPDFGLDRRVVQRATDPILVRVRQEPVADRAAFAREANESPVAEMSATERARADSAAMSPTLLESFAPNDDGNLLAAPNRPFVRRFFDEVIGPNERGRYERDGEITQEGVQRMRNAVLARAYGDSPVIERMAESTDDNVRNVSAAMVAAAPRLARLKLGAERGEFADLDVAAPLARAAELLSSVRDRGGTVESALRQEDMFVARPDEETALLARLLEKYKGSRGKVSRFLSLFADGVEGLGHPGQRGMFSESKTPTLLEALNATQRVLEGGEGRTASLFSEAGEAAGRDAKAVRGRDQEGAGEAAGAGGRELAAGAGGGGAEEVPGEAGGAPDLLTGTAEARAGGGRAGGRFGAALYGTKGRAKSAGLPRTLPPETTVADIAREARDELVGNVAPAEASDQAKVAAGTIREKAAERALKTARLDEKLRGALLDFDRKPVAENRDFIKRFETGQQQPTPELQAHADALRGVLDEGRAAVQALGTGKLRNFLTDYFPHLYKNVKKAAEWSDGFYDRRSLEGGKGWMKERYYPTLEDAEKAGLTPKFDNPVEYVLAHRSQVDKYVAAHRMVGEDKVLGIIKSFHVDQPLPHGWKKLDPAFGTLYGSRELPVEETVDRLLFEKLEAFANQIGVKHERLTGSGGTKGFTAPGSSDVTTQFATPGGVLAHEIGHQLDYRYGLWNYLGGGQKGRLSGAIGKELGALADLRHEGQQPTPSFSKYVRQADERVANLVDAYVNHRERLQQVAPQTYARFEKFLDDKNLGALRDARPSLTMETRENAYDLDALQVRGYLAAPEAVARLYERYLSPGLQDSRWYQGVRAVNNFMNQAQLGFSGFHAGFVTLDSMISKAALGAEQIGQGRFGEGLRNFAQGLLPTSAASTLARGSRAMREAFDPGGALSQDVERTLMGGGRFGQDAAYTNNAVLAFRRALAQQSFGKAALRAPGALMEAVAKPLMEWYVPRMKLGVFAELAESEIARLGPSATREQVRYALGRAWDSVDNRMGQLVHDNLFWNRTAKDLGTVAVRSLGWNVGDVRELGGAALDIATLPGRLRGGRPYSDAPVTHRMAYAVALPVVAGLYGALYQYLKTGEAPKEAKDLFFPRTGGTNSYGGAERLNFPSYMKDVYAYSRDFPTGAVDTAKGKTGPLVSAVGEMLQNRDFFHHPIFTPGASLPAHALEGAEYAGKQLVPFSFRSQGARENPRSEIGAFSRIAFGAHPAPRYISQPQTKSRFMKGHR